MIRCLTKNNKAFTLVEMMMAISFSVLLLTGVYGFYNASSQSYSAGVSGQTMQDGVDIVLKKIIEGGTEPSGLVFRLSTAGSAYIPNQNMLYYCQDSPCTPQDSTARWYTLDPTNTQILYYHPTSNPLGYDVIYVAPTGSTFFNPANNTKTLRFSYAKNSSGVTLPNVIEIDVVLEQNLAANQQLATIGTASTFVLLRDHP